MAIKERIKKENKERRRGRARKKIFGTAQKPRLNVFRGLKHVLVQLIDDQKSATLAFAKDGEIQGKKSNKTDLAFKVGELIAVKAKKIGVSEAVFDRAGYKYHGRVKAVADGARAGGLKF